MAMRSSSVASADWPRVETENPGARAVTRLSWLHQTERQLMHYAVTHGWPYFAACERFHVPALLSLVDHHHITPEARGESVDESGNKAWLRRLDGSG